MRKMAGCAALIFDVIEFPFVAPIAGLTVGGAVVFFPVFGSPSSETVPSSWKRDQVR